MNTLLEVLERKRIGTLHKQKGNNVPTPALTPFERECYAIAGDLPFTRESVRAYKKLKLREERAKLKIFFPLCYASVTWTLNGILLAFTILLAGVVAMSTLVIFAASTGFPKYDVVLLLWSLAAFCIAGGMLCAAAYALKRLDAIRVPYWRLNPFYLYKMHSLSGVKIPNEVCKRVYQFEARFPGCIYVDYLTYTGDPFLVVKHGRKRHYVHVWDEAEFPPE